MELQRSLVAEVDSLKKQFNARDAHAVLPAQSVPTAVPTPVSPRGLVPPPIPPAPILPESSSLESPAHTQSDRHMSDSDSEGDGGVKIDQRKTAKRSWAGKMFDYLPDVDRPTVQEPDKADSWWGMKTKKSSSHDYACA